MLVSIYSHVDSSSTVGGATSDGKTGTRVANTPKSWGHLIEGSRGKGISTFVRDFGGGHKTVTHVLWAR